MMGEKMETTKKTTLMHNFNNTHTSGYGQQFF